MRSILALCVAALLLGGCGGDVDPVAGDDAPAITAPGTTQPYDEGGADGSGGDGADRADQRGGVGASADSPDVREAD